ncbi:acyltransferase [Geobacillus stearothermophilus]|nr:acyltransferase [Geobacillus stearothermophilus]WJQ11142.1 acyltransferase [Geobacillus stearothermophilus]
MENVNKRIFGLDLVRCIAILLVLIAHSDFFFGPVFKDTLIDKALGRLVYYPFGFYGVEIFFVLSGFLIGRIIIKEIFEQGNWRNLLNFYIRRWFRTLPLYYLVMLVIFLYPTGAEFSWTNLLFLQNFNSEDLGYYPVTWSLSVEEWFYFTIPMVMLLYTFLLKNKGPKTFMTICFGIIGISLALRILMYFYGEQSFDFGTRKQVFLRMDSLIMGVILAGVKFYFEDIYNYLLSKRKKLLIYSLFGFILCEIWFAIHNREALNSSFFSRTIYFNLVSIICSMFMVSMDGINLPKNKRLVKLISTISIISYSLYLLHFKIYAIVSDILTLNNLAIGILGYLLALSLTIVISFFVNKYFEIPIMNLRDNIKFLSRDGVKRDVSKAKGA